MADLKKPHECPFFTRQAGLPAYCEEQGAIKGYSTQDAADADAKDRNERAAAMGLTATYEVVANPTPAVAA